MRVLVTGANGFVGRAVVDRCLQETAWTCRAAVRATAPATPHVQQVRVGDLGASTDWREALEGVDVVVHTAARVHKVRETSTDPLPEYRRVNVAGTEALARQAARMGVRRLVFVSSVKVLGESSQPGHPLTATMPSAPAGPYGVSKLEAEQVLWDVAAETGLEVSIVRPVLVYGPGVSSNFAVLLRAVHRGVPLPLGLVDNQRSLVSVQNLADALVTCVGSPAASGGTFLVSDGEDVSTAALIRRLASSLGVPARLWRVPPALLKAAGGVIGRAAAVNRLCDSLQVDISATRATLRWTPPVSLDAGLAHTAKAYLNMRHRW